VESIYACSGAANTGYLADAVDRKIAKAGTGKMTCLVAVGAGILALLNQLNVQKRM